MILIVDFILKNKHLRAPCSIKHGPRRMGRAREGSPAAAGLPHAVPPTVCTALQETGLSPSCLRGDTEGRRGWLACWVLPCLQAQVWELFSTTSRYSETKKAQSQGHFRAELHWAKWLVVERRDNEKCYVNYVPLFFQTEQIKYLACLEGSNLPRNMVLLTVRPTQCLSKRWPAALSEVIPDGERLSG